MSEMDRVRVVGPLAPYAHGFGAELLRQGYSPLSAANLLRLMADLSRWLGSRGMAVGELTDEQVDAFVASRRERGYVHWLSRRGVAPLMGYLRGLGVVSPPVAVEEPGPVERLLADYRRYLRDERALAAGTVRRYEGEARVFVTGRGEAGLAGVTAGEVSDFVVGRCAGCCRGSAKYVVTVMRSLLRFGFVSGRVDVDLSAAVPSVAGYRDAGLPKALAPQQVSALLDGCDRDRAVGRRDFAILTVLARLGLRACEVAALELSDIDWRAGEITVHGKGGYVDRLPLPVDVGEAVVAYLCAGRPEVRCSRVFLRARAPHGLMSSGTVQNLVHTACDRAGVPRVGAHRLRHTVATAALRAGAPLPEVAQLLRQRHLSSTTIYAKLDRTALASLARRWPGSAS